MGDFMMSLPRKFLRCTSLAATQAQDAEICAFFRTRDGNKGGQWSGVFVSGDQYAVAWDEQLRDIFGATRDADIETEAEVGEWTAYVPPQEEP